MSTNALNNSPSPAPVPQDKRRKVVIVATMPREGAVNLVVAMMAAVVSIGVHVVLVVLMLTVGMGSATAVPTGEVKSEAVMEDKKEEKEVDLTQDDIGLDPSVPTNFNVDKIEEVSVPGMVNPTEAAGVVGAPEGPARTLPAPPGTGGGQGGAVFYPTQAGTAAMFGQLGGMGGIANLGGFAGRSGATREKMLQEGGGNAISEACVAKGLSWLARHQAADGRWSLNEFHLNAREKPFPAGKVIKCNCTGMADRRDDVSATAFALLPFLAAGITHQPSKTQMKEDYYKTVRAGLEFIKSKQAKDGSYSTLMYSHGLITIAMCEAYGLTSDPSLKASAQRALNFIVQAQDPNGGGWRYSPRQPGDTSVVGWQLMALKSGQMAGLSVPADCLKKAERFLDSCEVKNGGAAGYGYSYVPGSAATETMTSAALLCRMYLGVNPRNPNLLMGIDRLRKLAPHQTKNYYYLYYATQVMHHFGGDAWDQWNKGTTGSNGIRDILIKEMDKGLTPANNHQDGSWAPNAQGHVNAGGRIMSTSLALLCLEVYYRHLPLYRRDLGVMKAER